MLAAAAAGRRTESAFPGFVAAHGFDATLYATRPVAGVSRLPEVTGATELVSAPNGQPACDCTHQIDPSELTVSELPQGGSLFNLISGHLPNPSATNQILASFTLEQDDGVHVGSVIRVPFFARTQASALLTFLEGHGVKLPRPTGPTVAFHVVGIEASEPEFPAGATPDYDLVTTPAFGRVVIPRSVAFYEYFVRLRHGAADLRSIDASASELGRAGIVGYANETGLAISVEGSIHPQAIGWWILAGLAALVGLAVVGQALGRQSIAESQDYPTMAALGADRPQLFALEMARNLTVGIVGVAGAVGIATALSPIAPLGEARIAEASKGIAFDSLVLPLGALIGVVVVLALGLWPALRAARKWRTDERGADAGPSMLVERLAAAGAPPTAVIGVRNAVERRSGGAAIPVASALLGTLLAVVALCGTAVFGASLSHLTATPPLYGEPEQLAFTYNGATSPALVKTLEADRAITGITELVAIELSVNKVNVGGVAGANLRGPLLFSSADGHLPDGPGQIALGATTMHRVGAHLGSVVHVTVSMPSGGKRTTSFRVVSQVSFPVLSGVVSLGTGAALTSAAYAAAACPPVAHEAACQRAVHADAEGGSSIFASVVSGKRGQAAIVHYLDAYNGIAALPVIPTSLINFGQAVNFPVIFGAILAVFGAATLAHLLIVSVSRRRRETGLLKVLGFVNAQVVSAVAWQATTLAVIGIAIGAPLGVVVGQTVWRTFANNLGVVPVSVVPLWLVGLLVGGVIITANFIAVGPALVATRSKSGDLLRTA